MSLDRTMFAAEAFNFSDRFHTCFVRSQIEGFELFLTAPEGQSTGGGLQAVQHITLRDEVSNRAFVLGSAHGLTKKVQIRSYGSLARSFAQRFPGVPFPVPQEEHEELKQSFVKFFEMLKFEVELEEEPAAIDPVAAAVPAPAVRTPSTKSPSPRPSPSPGGNAQRRPRGPLYARGAGAARKGPPPFSLTDFVSNLPRAYLLLALGLVAIPPLVYALFFAH